MMAAWQSCIGGRSGEDAGSRDAAVVARGGEQGGQIGGWVGGGR